MDEIIALFQAQADLEGLLIAEPGRESEGPVGTVTKWDLVEAI